MQPLTLESPAAQPPTKPNSDRVSLQSRRSFLGLGADRAALIALGLLIAYAIGRSLCEAFIRPLWFDEICTWIMVREHPLSVLWSALRDGVDGQPPLFYLLERPVTAAIANDQIGFRLLSILGFSSTVACLFFLIRRRSGSRTALLCAAIPLVTLSYDWYAVNSRPYTLILACLSLALLCYDRAPEVRWVFLMGLSLAMAEALHYYAVLALPPFLLGEMALSLRIRRLRWSVWLAFAGALIPLVAFWPLLSAAKASYGAHFWAQPSFAQALGSYGWLFRTTQALGLVAAGAAVLALLPALIVSNRASHGEFREDSLLHLRVAALGFVALPFLCFFAAKIAHGGMTERYMMPAILGFPLAAGFTLPRRGRGSFPILAGFALCLCALLVRQEVQFWSSYSPVFVSPAQPVEALVTSLHRPDLPVVVSDPISFLKLIHYSSPGLPGRFVTVLDPPEAVQYSGSDTTEKDLAVMRNYVPLPIYDFAPFAAQHPEFLLYAGSEDQELDWWPRRLRRDGYTLQPLVILPALRVLFLVSRGNNEQPKEQSIAFPASGDVSGAIRPAPSARSTP